MKKILISAILFLNLSCSKPKIVYNDYSFTEKIDRKFFTKGGTTSPENRLELYIIERENNKLVKKTLVNRKKEDIDLKDRHSFFLNYNNNKLYLLFYKNIDIGAEPERAKIFYYDKDYNLKPFNDYEYVFDNLDNSTNEIKYVDDINCVIDNKVYYNILFEGEFENNKKIVKDEIRYIHDYNKNEKEFYLVTGKNEEGDIVYTYNIEDNKLTKSILNKNSKYFYEERLELDDENIIYPKGNLLVRKNLKTKKERILYKAYDKIGRIFSLNKENTLITFGVSNDVPKIAMIMGYINKWKINHDVVYDLKENKIYMLETANLNLIKKEEQLRLMTEIINYGLEKD